MGTGQRRLSSTIARVFLVACDAGSGLEASNMVSICNALIVDDWQNQKGFIDVKSGSVYLEGRFPGGLLPSAYDNAAKDISSIFT
jgi:hypothetical protein